MTFRCLRLYDKDRPIQVSTKVIVLCFSAKIGPGVVNNGKNLLTSSRRNICGISYVHAYSGVTN